jgi:large subunit ribosomal protein L30
VESLGLRKRLQSIYLPKRPEIAGSILAVKELLHVDNVRRINLQPEDQFLPDKEARWVDDKGEVVDWGKDSRRAPRGYQVVGSRLHEEL